MQHLLTKSIVFCYDITLACLCVSAPAVLGGNRGMNSGFVDIYCLYSWEHITGVQVHMRN